MRALVRSSWVALVALLLQEISSCYASSACLTMFFGLSNVSRIHAPFSKPWMVFDTPTLVSSPVTVKMPSSFVFVHGEVALSAHVGCFYLIQRLLVFVIWWCPVCLVIDLDPPVAVPHLCFGQGVAVPNVWLCDGLRPERLC